MIYFIKSKTIKYANIFLFLILILFSVSVFQVFGSAAQETSEKPLTVVSSSGASTNALVKSILEIYKERTGTEFELLEIPYDGGNATKKVLTMWKGGNPPDLIKASTAAISSLKPIMLPITDPELVEFAKKVWPGYEGFMYNEKGELIALQHYATIQGLILNKTLFEKAGMSDLIPQTESEIWTWDEFIDIVDKVMTATGARYGLTYDFTPARYITFLYQWGGRLFDDDGTIYINDENSVKALSKFKEYHDRALMPKEVWIGGEDSLQLFMTGEAVALFSGTWDIPVAIRDNNKFEAVQALNPIGKIRSTTPGGNFWVGIKDSGNEEKVIKFLKEYYLNGLDMIFHERAASIDAYGRKVDYKNEKVTKAMEGFQKELGPTPLYTTSEWTNADVIPTLTGKLKEAILLVLNGDKEPQEALDVVAKAVGQAFQDTGVTPKYKVTPK